MDHQVGHRSSGRQRARQARPWDTFHLTELRQLLERDWRAGDRRVMAGLSMGGYAALYRLGRTWGATPQAPGSGLGVVGGQELEDLTDRGPVAQRGDAGVALAGVQP